jgi:hypothetical protein
MAQGQNGQPLASELPLALKSGFRRAGELSASDVFCPATRRATE